MQDKEFYKYKRIVFLVETPFTARDENRFGIFQYLLKGFIVEVIDISNVYRKNNLYKIAKESLEEKDYIRNIFSVRELVSALSQNLYTTIVFLQTHHHLALIKLLNELSIDYIAHSVNQIPSIDVDETLYENLIRIFKTYSIFKLGPKIFAGVSNKIENFLLRKISNPKFILAGGKNSILIYSPRILSRSKIVWAHALDYDLYLKSIHNNIKDDFIDIFGLKYSFDELRNSIVFLDEYNPYHPDFDFLKIPHADKPEKYYPAIERFFLYLEKKYNLRVIIAAHPRSDYKSKNHFKGFPIIKDRTLDLIKISSLVLLHSSTSVNFVNIFKKPAIFFYTSTMTQIYKMTAELFSKWHRTSAIEININSDFDRLNIDNLKNQNLDYTAYFNAFIKNEYSPLKFSWEILMDELECNDAK